MKDCELQSTENQDISRARAELQRLDRGLLSDLAGG